jgi:hypothetical protein
MRIEVEFGREVVGRSAEAPSDLETVNVKVRERWGEARKRRHSLPNQGKQ